MEESNQSSKSYATYILGGLLVIAAFFIGTLWTKVQNLETNGGKVAGETAQVPEQLPAQPDQAGAPAPVDVGVVPPVTEADHLRGSLDADIFLIEYSDYECPFCSRFHPTMEQVLSEYGEKVTWVYRHFPLSFHPQAQKLAESSECVADLGGNEAFWKFTDAAYSQPLAQNIDTLDTVVTSAGVDAVAFNECLSNGKYTQKVSDHMTAGQTAGVTGTPGTFVLTKDGKGELISGALPFAQVKQVIDKYL